MSVIYKTKEIEIEHNVSLGTYGITVYNQDIGGYGYTQVSREEMTEIIKAIESS